MMNGFPAEPSPELAMFSNSILPSISMYGPPGGGGGGASMYGPPGRGGRGAVDGWSGAGGALCGT